MKKKAKVPVCLFCILNILIKSFHLINLLYINLVYKLSFLFINLMKILLLLTFIIACLSYHFTQDQEPIIQEVNSRQQQWRAGHNKYFEGKTL